MKDKEIERREETKKKEKDKKTTLGPSVFVIVSNTSCNTATILYASINLSLSLIKIKLIRLIRLSGHKLVHADFTWIEGQEHILKIRLDYLFPKSNDPPCWIT